MSVVWTEDQRKVINIRNRNLLVSAAAGSGKTAVLVERIVSLITDKEHPVDVDRLLITTFTKAAAGEMKERIGKALSERLKEDPHMNGCRDRNLWCIGHRSLRSMDSVCM